MIQVKEFTLGPLAQHPLVVFDDQSKDAFLVDLGYDNGEIENFLETQNFNLLGIFNTHAHIDHMGATVTFQKKYNLDFYLGRGERVVLEYAPISAQNYQLPLAGIPEIKQEIGAEFSLPVGEYIFQVIETPGHTPGGLCYYCEQAKILLAGDTLFAGSIGRTDLPGGDYATIMQSLEKLKALPSDTVVYCGHGEQTTIGQELQTNPFLRQ
jgi:glyoxylase-like metal-dependent hydrolase (beta-lactamase superfamily II)